MNRISGTLAALLVLAIAGAGWLYWQNRELESELAEARARLVVDPDVRPEATAGSSGDESPRAATPRPRRSWLFGRSSEPRPEVERAEKETRVERRQRRQAEIAAMFGRLDGETAEEYRARMVPFIEMMLAGPRDRVAEARRAAEQVAGVTAEQREHLDRVFEDAYSEVIELTNSAIQSGDLTPYSRNWSGVLNFAGGVGAVLESTESRIDSILSREQIDILYDRGFEWGEYLGASVPWERLDPPPPPEG